MHTGSRFGESELIINGKGYIYHLDISPEQLADSIITVGDPGRVPMVSKYFDKITHQSQHREFVCHAGRIGRKEVLVVSTGIGPDNIDIVMNELDALANIDFDSRTLKPVPKTLSIIRLGTCGSLHADVPVGAIVTSAYGIGMDNLLQYYRYENNADEHFIMDNFMQHTRLAGSNIAPYIAEGSIALRKHFAAGYIHGITVTCPGFYGPQGRVLRAQVVHPYLVDAMATFSTRDLRITNFEMETAALYGLGKILGHNCCSVSTVIDNRATNTASRTMDTDIEHMIKTALATIEQMS